MLRLGPFSGDNVAGSAIHDYFKIQADMWDAWMQLLLLHPAAALVLPTRPFASVAKHNLSQRARFESRRVRRLFAARSGQRLSASLPSSHACLPVCPPRMLK